MLSPGDYFFVDYGTAHSYRAVTEDFYVINCCLRPQLIDKAFVSQGSFNEACNQFSLRILHQRPTERITDRIFKADESIKQLFYKIAEEFENKRSGYIEIIHGAICEIIIRALRNLSHISSFSPLTNSLIKEIGSRYSTPITLGGLCRELHYSPSYASTLFRSETGLTFTEYLQNIRIKESCYLLKYTNRTISDISEAVGYNDIKTFNLRFKSLTDTAPRQYRKMSLEMQNKA